MSIVDTLTKVKSKRVCGIDASTNSFAFAIFDGEVPILCGEVKFDGSTPFERLRDSRKKVRALVDEGVFDGVDFVVIESAIMVRNIQTAIDLAYVYGSIMSEMSEVCDELHKVAPISWQTHYGVPNLKKDEKEQLQKDHPGKSKSWYQNRGRQVRKARILETSRKYFDIPNSSDDVGDAVGIAYFGATRLTRE